MPQTAQELLCESRGGRPGLPVPNRAPRPYGICGCKATLNKRTIQKRPELRSCVKVEVAVLGSPSLTARTVSVDERQHGTELSQSSVAVWKSRWLSWAPRPNESDGFCGHKTTLNSNWRKEGRFFKLTFCFVLFLLAPTQLGRLYQGERLKEEGKQDKINIRNTLRLHPLPPHPLLPHPSQGSTVPGSRNGKHPTSPRQRKSWSSVWPCSSPARHFIIAYTMSKWHKNSIGKLPAVWNVTVIENTPINNSYAHHGSLYGQFDVRVCRISSFSAKINWSKHVVSVWTV